MSNFKIIGCGGAGVKTVNYIKNKNNSDITCIVMDFDEKSLSDINADVKKFVDGEGIDAIEIFKEIGISEQDTVFLIAGLGGSCGGYLAGSAAAQLKNIVCGYFFMPYQFEGAARNEKAAIDYATLAATGINIVKMDNNTALENALNEQKDLTVEELQDKAFEDVYTDILKRISDGIYKGESLNGKPHGKGKLTTQSGNVYEGDFEDGAATGKGKVTLPNGGIYEGDFVDSAKTGKGKYIWSDGDVYEGDFVDGKMTGKGKYIWSDGDVYEGDFVDDKMTGKGKYIWPDGKVYEGDFVDGAKTGKGKYIWSDGDVYEGDFVDDKMTGKGKYIWSDGDVYEGNFIEGTRIGKGKYTYANGETEEVEFDANGEVIG